jgi:hypothetical protein
LGVRQDYKLFENIVNYFPPSEAPKQPTIPLVFCGILVILVVTFIVSVTANSGNLNNLSFSGCLFVINYLLILGVIVAFWIKVNLVNTLWILVALAPVTLFTMNVGINAESCQVQEFFLKAGQQKQRN